MAISRFRTSSVAQGLPKYQKFLCNLQPLVGSWGTVSTSLSDQRLIASNGTSSAVLFPYGTTSLYTTNGTSWSTASFPYNTICGIWNSANNRYESIAYGSDNYMISSDGITWTSGSLSNRIGGTSTLAYGNGVYVMGGRSGGTRYSSTLGGAWNTSTNNIAVGDPRVVFGNGIFVMITSGGSTSYYTSTDGNNWTTRTASISVSGIGFSNGRFFMNDSNQTASSSFLTSTDGINWTTKSFPSSAVWSPPAWVNGVWVTTTTTTSAYSVDYTNWTTKAYTAASYTGYPVAALNTYALQCPTASNIYYLSVTKD